MSFCSFPLYLLWSCTNNEIGPKCHFFSLHLYNSMSLAKDKQCDSVAFLGPWLPTMQYCLLRMTLSMHLAPLPFRDLKALFRAMKYFYPVCEWAINREVKQFTCVHVASLWKITGPVIEKSFLNIWILLNINRPFSYAVDAQSSSRA